MYLTFEKMKYQLCFFITALFQVTYDHWMRLILCLYSLPLVAIVVAQLRPLTTFGLWIGLNSVVEQDKWEWVDNNPVVYTNWNEGEPNMPFLVIMRGKLEFTTNFPVILA